MRHVIPHLVICPTCSTDHEPLTGKPAPEPYGTPVETVTYRSCAKCLAVRRTAREWYEHEGSPLHTFAVMGKITEGIQDEVKGAIITAYYDQTDLTPLRQLAAYLENGA